MRPPHRQRFECPEWTGKAEQHADVAVAHDPSEAVLLRDYRRCAFARRRSRVYRECSCNVGRRQLDCGFLRDRVVAKPALRAALIRHLQLHWLCFAAGSTRDRQRRFEHFVIHLGVAEVFVVLRLA